MILKENNKNELGLRTSTRRITIITTNFAIPKNTAALKGAESTMTLKPDQHFIVGIVSELQCM